MYTLEHSALILVDVQRDFVSGTLTVPNANEIFEPLDKLIKQDWPLVVATQDWHPPHHVSFASTHGVSPFSPIEIVSESGTKYASISWPDHCIQNEAGAEFLEPVSGAVASGRALVVQKGDKPNMECYSAFEDVIMEQFTDLGDILTLNNIKSVHVAGLALDYCVGETALSAARRGLKTFVHLNATRAVAEDTEQAMLARLRDAEIELVN